uniref:Uncharacterized protein n=1 Tax=Rhizophora mucronata TaxID=61149 RepID=A0A2P2NMW7_RHIMU
MQMGMCSRSILASAAYELITYVIRFEQTSKFLIYEGKTI